MRIDRIQIQAYKGRDNRATRIPPQSNPHSQMRPSRASRRLYYPLPFARSRGPLLPDQVPFPAPPRLESADRLVGATAADVAPYAPAKVRTYFSLSGTTMVSPSWSQRSSGKLTVSRL